MSYGSAGRRIYCPKCGVRVGSGVADSHLLACDETDQAAEAAEWQPMETAPKGGAVILAQAKNCGNCWKEPCPVWWAENTVTLPEPPVFTHFWADARDANGHAISCYRKPLRWRQLPPSG